MTTWQVQTAKQRFSEVLRDAATGEPQFITKHGNRVAVVLDYAEYERTFGTQPSFADFLLDSLSAVGLEDDLELPTRNIEPARETGLEGL